ncbi:hypothetical protein BC834DRAFT_1042389 [Gloeopeniophorella convolvens]|nr:hypothetical protein BC834DRAFT_1042389 [Gloeopeniophorella convolvens]
MFSTLLSASLLSVLAIRAVRADFAVQTPIFTQCQPAQFAWNTTDGPYNVIVVDEANECGPTLADLGDHNSSSLTWTVSIPAGKKVLVSVLDGKSQEAWSGPIEVQPSSNTSCLSAADRAAIGGNATSIVVSLPGSSSAAAPSSTPAAPATPATPIIYGGQSTDGTPDASLNPDANSPDANNAGSDPAAPIGAVSGALSSYRLSAPALALGAITALLAVAF